MSEKNTKELENILKKTHPEDFEQFCRDNLNGMENGEQLFSAYIKSLLSEKKLTQQSVFLRADIPEGYGYKLLSGEKHTRQRDIIIRLCYAGELTLEETQRALRLYGLPELYAKIPRDALLMIAFNERPGDILEINELLKKHHLDLLRTSGVQD